MKGFWNERLGCNKQTLLVLFFVKLFVHLAAQLVRGEEIDIGLTCPGL